MKVVICFLLLLHISFPLTGGQILVTGFGPFGRFAQNISYEGLAPLDGKQLDGYVITVAELPVAWEESKEILQEAVKELAPNAVLLTGIDAHASSSIVIEARGINRVVRASDIHGNLPPDRKIIPGGSKYLHTQADTGAVKASLQEEGIDTEISSNPGGYLCGWIYYHALSAWENIPVLFVHIPPDIHPPLLREAASIILQEMIAGEKEIP